MFENPRRGRQARDFTTNVPKILVLNRRKLRLGAPAGSVQMCALPLDKCSHLTSFSQCRSKKEEESHYRPMKPNWSHYEFRG